MPISEPRTLPQILARRALLGRHTSIELPRERWKIDQVLCPEECAVLLGFSRDGHYLLYYSHWESTYELRWKSISSIRNGNHDYIHIIPVGPIQEQPHQTSSQFNAMKVDAGLRVWQSTDNQLVVAIMVDRHLTSQDTGPSYHITISPSPVACETIGASIIKSLRFSFTLPSLTQELQRFQLKLSRNSHRLVLNMGASVMIVYLQVACDDADKSNMNIACTEQSPFSSHHAEWFASPEFPLEFHTHTHALSWIGSTSKSVQVQCLHQHQFDVESFLSNFLNKYSVFRTLHLVDYDLLLTSVSKSALYMSCTADLQSSTYLTNCMNRNCRLVLFFSLKLDTGSYHVIRALKVPQSERSTLRHLSRTVNSRFQCDLLRYQCDENIPMEWHNDPVVQEQSLYALHNPLYPLSIYLK